jgi:hypothetical protein
MASTRGGNEWSDTSDLAIYTSLHATEMEMATYMRPLAFRSRVSLQLRILKRDYGDEDPLAAHGARY